MEGDRRHRILFVCHGNICRSTMAQFVFENLARRAGAKDAFTVDSAATSREEIGNPPHPGTVRKLREVGIPVGVHAARQVRRDEYGDWDLLVYMDEENKRGLARILGRDATGGIDDPAGKCVKLLEYAREDPGLRPAATDRHGRVRDVADPWYTGNFDDTYRDVLAGCEGLLASLGGDPRG